MNCRRKPRSGPSVATDSGVWRGEARSIRPARAEMSRDTKALGRLWMSRAPEFLNAYDDIMSLERISIDPARMQGVPCIRGTRITVSAVLGQLAAGRSIDEILADYPQLKREDVLAALEYAAAATREREIPLSSAG